MKINVRDELLSLRDDKYLEFTKKLLPGVENIIGVRLPEIKKIARRIASGNFESYLAGGGEIYFEETMLRGMVTGLAKTDISRKLELVRCFIPKIDNWSVCDSFCCAFKFSGRDAGTVHGFVVPYLSSEREFDVRFALVILLKYFVNGEYIDSTVRLAAAVRHSGYYAQMAQAWALAECYIKFPEKTRPYLEKSGLDDFTYGRTLQKIIDSTVLSREEKDRVRAMRRG